MLWQALPKTGRRYGDGEAQRSYGDGGGRKQRRKKNDDDGVSAFITRLRSKKKPCHGLHHASATPKMATTTTGSQRKLAGGDSCPTVLFNLFTKLPFILKSKLLPNLCNNSKISKNKSCSKFKALQLCFYTHTQIRSTF